MATMREVAARAGVSPKTVSRVFNDDPHVTPETRARVERVMRELNYVPNALATTFRSGRSRAIGVAVPDIVDPFFAAIARSVEGVAREHGLSTLVTSLGEDPAEERGAIESLLARQLTGLVLAPVGTVHSWLARWQGHTSIVFVDRAPLDIVADSFTDDDRGGAVAGTQHLVEHGHRRIAYLGDRLDLSTEINRLAGYRAALERAGIAFDEGLVVANTARREPARAALDRLRSLADPPTAIFSSNARTSMSLVYALAGRPTPVVGFGDFPFADAVTPAFTVLDQSPARLGELAARRIFERVEHPDRSLERSITLDVALLERASCGV
ncbi:LacI family DNA-binding transcriptional regulator [Leucobacter sp. CSA1]|uniref:LacI family DNA-binding transcriptional regulator n=1 Tax=Leucobacter chromiisoli TaxID=2796471 RepID=A0A934Q6U9_9MICO|nr:LacI family DNA-binding transcriptional regulator [Leucobacter chromiisoli]MBK0418513.1 LacI family DNA-binding transcriptional regulator [Leucobacter chromiisoli]